MRQNDIQTSRARRLRREMTDAEKAIWHQLRNRRFRGLKFRRQVPIGPYIVDFLCSEHRLIVEIDGGQHDERIDAPRTAFLTAKGYRVLRFWNSDVRHRMNGVLERLAGEVGP